MSLQEIANELVAGCKEGREAENLEKLYATDAVSIEPMVYGEMPRETAGVQGIKGKHDWWESQAEMHDFSVDGPYLHGDDKFAVNFTMDCTMKDSGERMKMSEVAVYTVESGKIVREEFFSPPMG